MAIPIQFEGLGEDLIAGMKSARDAIAGVRDELGKTNSAITEQAQKGTAAFEKFSSTAEVTARTIANVGKQAQNGNTGKLAKDIGDVATASTKAAKAQQDVSKSIAASRVQAAQAIRDTKGLTEAQKQASAAAGGITKEYNAIVAAGQQLPDAPKRAAEGAKSLRTQLREAKLELDAIVEASDGKITPELIAAAQKAGQLQDRFEDINATVQAFNPDRKFQAFIGVLSNAASGVQAITAGMGLFGSESEDVNRALLKIQQTTAFVQGLQGFLGGLQDNLKNIRTLIVANTVATRASATATTASAAATATQATASTAAAGATAVLTGAFQALKVAIATNPIGALAVALLAIVGAMIAFGNSTEDADEKLGGLIDKLDALRERRFTTIDIDLKVSEITAQIEQLGIAEDDYSAQIDAVTASTKRQIDALLEKQSVLERDADAIIANARAAAIAGDLGEEAAQKAADAAQAKRDEARKLAGEQVVIAKEGERAVAEIRQQSIADQVKTDAEKLDKAKENAKRRAEVELQLVEQLAAANKALQDALKAQQFDAADPNERLDLERQAALEVIDIKRDELIQIKALAQARVQIGQDTFDSLTEAQQKARAEALIDAGAVTLSVEQERTITAIQLGIWTKYYEDLRELERIKRAERAQGIVDPFERERALFDIQLKARTKQLEDAGSTEIEVMRFVEAEKTRFRTEQALKALELDEGIAKAEIDQVAASAGGTVAAERAKQEAVLKVQIEFALKRAELLEAMGTPEADAQAAQIRALVANLQGELKNLKDSAPKIDLFDLLGIDVSEKQKQQVQDSLNSIVQSVQTAVAAIYAAQQQQLENQIGITDELIADKQRERSELERELDRQIENQRLGLANNVANIQKAIAKVKDEERAALEEKKRLQAENARLARQQAQIEAVIQAAKMVTAAAQMIADGASQGGWVGALVAAAAVAGVIATFIASQSKIKGATAQASFRHGGKTSGLIEGPSHEQGGLGIYNEKSGVRVGEMEGKEFIVSGKAYRKNPKLVEAVNDNDIGRVAQLAVEQLMASQGIQMDGDKVKEIVMSKETYVQRTTLLRDDSTAKEVRKLHAEVSELRADMAREKEAVTHTPNGREITKSGTTRTIR